MTTTILSSEAVCKLDNEATDAADFNVLAQMHGWRCERTDMILGTCADTCCRPDLKDVDYGEGVDLTGVNIADGGSRWRRSAHLAPVAGDDGDDSQLTSIPVTKVA